MNCLALFGDFFEDTEAITTMDIIFRAGIALDKVNMGDDEKIVTQCQNVMCVPLMYKDIKMEDYDFLIIPGGGAVFNVLMKDSRVDDLVHYFVKANKPVFAICAGPMTIGKHGYFRDKKFTCFPSCEEGICGEYTKDGVTVSGNFITGKSMAYTVDFGLAIVEKLLGKDKKKEVEAKIYAK